MSKLILDLELLTIALENHGDLGEWFFDYG